MSDFKYSSDKINEIIDNNKLGKVCMQGVYRDLQKLKPIIEKIYDDHIFYLSYWENDAGYHGWDWNEDDGRLKNQAAITDGITEKFKEIYALILAGLGKRCEEICQSHHEDTSLMPDEPTALVKVYDTLTGIECKDLSFRCLASDLKLKEKNDV